MVETAKDKKKKAKSEKAKAEAEEKRLKHEAEQLSIKTALEGKLQQSQAS